MSDKIDTSDGGRYWRVPDENLSAFDQFFDRGGTLERLGRLGFIRGEDGKFYRDIQVGAKDTSDPEQYREVSPERHETLKGYLLSPGGLHLLGRMGDVALGRDGKFYVQIYHR